MSDDTTPTAAGPSSSAERAERAVLKDSYGLLFLLILATITAVSLVEGTGWQVTLVTLMFSATLVLALYTSDGSRRLIGAGLVVGLISVVFALPFTPASLLGAEAMSGIWAGVWALLAAVSALTVLRALVRFDRITGQAILGVVCVYLLLGLAFMMVFFVIYIAQGGFFADQSTATSSELVYFSYVTLTTLGYGDFAPGSDMGRYAAAIEAIIGQIFLVIVVARFVSLWGRDLPPGRKRSE